MLLYNSIYLCSCESEGSVLTPDNLPRASKILPDLLFCPTCHVPRCFDCCKIDILAKYCCGCMTEYTDVPGATRCLKNCFECPECHSPTTVVASDSAVENTRGKQFHFQCVHCTYTYQTEVITKPAPLSKILRASGDQRFSKLADKYNAARELKSDPVATSISRLMAEKLKLMDLPMPPRADVVDYHLERSRVPSTSSATALPLGKHLLAKRRYSCPACDTSLENPVADPKLMKFLDKELALDTVPLLVAKIIGSREGETRCVLSILNPLPTTINAKLSTTESVPVNLSAAAEPITVSLPVTSVVVPARREKVGVLETLPTEYLGDATEASRAEKLARSVKNSGSIDWWDDTEAKVEKGANWVTVPFSYSAATDETTEAPKIPLYVSVETKMPPKWNQARAGLKFGFWVLIALYPE